MTLVQTILKEGTSSRFGNVPTYPSVVCDKGVAEMSKEVCVVNAADYSYFRSGRGDSVTQTLVGKQSLKTSLPSDINVGRAFHGVFWYNIPRNIRRTFPQATTGTHSTCPHGTHVEAAVTRRSAELPPLCPSKDVPNDLSHRSLSNSASYFRFFASFSRCTLSKSARGASVSLRTLSKSAYKAATFSSDKTITLYLAVPAPRRCLSYILLRCPGPRWPPYQLYLTRCPRPLFGHGLSLNKISRKKNVRRLPGSQMCTSPHWPD